MSEDSNIKFCPGCGNEWKGSPCKMCGMIGENNPVPALKMDENFFRAFNELNAKLDAILFQQKQSGKWGYRIGSFLFNVIQRLFTRKISAPKNSIAPAPVPAPIQVPAPVIQPIYIPIERPAPQVPQTDHSGDPIWVVKPYTTSWKHTSPYYTMSDNTGTAKFGNMSFRSQSQ